MISYIEVSHRHTKQKYLIMRSNFRKFIKIVYGKIILDNFYKNLITY